MMPLIKKITDRETVMVARRSAALRAQVSFVEKKDTDQIVVEGGHRLNGVIDISGAKNSALILMCASLLAEETVRLTNVPSSLRDIRTLTKVLEQMGAIVATGPQREMAINAGKVDKLYADYELVNQMRASFLVLGPLLTRFNNAVVSLPGGCAIGERPVDFHLNALKAMGADIQTVGTNGYVHASAEGGLRGADITFPKISVGATENTMMAATLATGSGSPLGMRPSRMAAMVDAAATSSARARAVRFVVDLKEMSLIRRSAPS